MNVLVTYSDESMTQSMDLCCSSAMKNGVDVCWPQNPSTINDEFRKFNNEILSQPRGNGYWLWKPYIIYRAMLSCQENDILIYSDAGIEFVNNVNYIIDRMDENIFFFTNTHPNHHWTKAYTLHYMLPDWTSIYCKDDCWHQVQASVIFFKINKETKEFVKRWLLYCQIPDLINDVKTHEYDFFQDHRHDQSILTILATKANYKLHWWPTVYAEHIRVQGDDYPVLFNHHRKRNHGYGKGEPEW